MRAEHLIFLYVVLGLAIFAGLALFEERRRRSFEPSRDPDQVFRCQQCSLVYTDDPEVERSRCPACGNVSPSKRQVRPSVSSVSRDGRKAWSAGFRKHLFGKRMGHKQG